jgi:hypothetical protein
MPIRTILLFYELITDNPRREVVVVVPDIPQQQNPLFK